MPSAVLSDSRRQLTLDMDESLTTRFRCVRDVVAQGVYSRGLKSCAADLDLAPGNLSNALSDEGQRKLGTDEMERYIERTGDKTPIYYLIARYLGDQAAARDEAIDKVVALLQHMPEVLAQAGVQFQQRKTRTR